MRRFRALLATALLAIMALSATPASALTENGYTWSDGFGGWIDNNCSATSGYKVDLYEHFNYGGDKTRVCSWETEFCEVPMGGPTGAAGHYCATICAPVCLNLNDRVSSIDIIFKKSGYYLTFYQHSFYGGTATHYSTDQSQLADAKNDTFSSMRLVAQ